MFTYIKVNCIFMAKVIFEVNNLRNNNSIGRLVVSNNGRDKGNFYIVANIKEEYLYLVNGSTKTIEKPKKKKLLSFSSQKSI